MVRAIKAWQTTGFCPQASTPGIRIKCTVNTVMNRAGKSRSSVGALEGWLINVFNVSRCTASRKGFMVIYYHWYKDTNDFRSRTEHRGRKSDRIGIGVDRSPLTARIQSNYTTEIRRNALIDLHFSIDIIIRLNTNPTWLFIIITMWKNKYCFRNIYSRKKCPMKISNFFFQFVVIRSVKIFLTTTDSNYNDFFL